MGGAARDEPALALQRLSVDPREAVEAAGLDSDLIDARLYRTQLKWR